MCGSSEDLEVDHADRAEKCMPFSRMYVVNRERFEAELTKCQLLCKPCHIEKSVAEQGFHRRTEHGTYVSYRYGKCRCKACRKANAEASRRHRERKKNLGG
jgi:hypothetical protein